MKPFSAEKSAEEKGGYHVSALTRRINIISRCAASYRTARSTEGLPGIYHSYVIAICRNPGWSQERLSRHLCINKSNITRHLAYLEENGYIERRTCEKDKRELLVYPTEKMLALLPDVMCITREWNALLTDGIGEEELAAFLSVLERISDRARDILYSSAGGSNN